MHIGVLLSKYDMCCMQSATGILLCVFVNLLNPKCSQPSNEQQQQQQTKKRNKCTHAMRQSHNDTSRTLNATLECHEFLVKKLQYTPFSYDLFYWKNWHKHRRLLNSSIYFVQNSKYSFKNSENCFTLTHILSWYRRIRKVAFLSISKNIERQKKEAKSNEAIGFV